MDSYEEEIALLSVILFDNKSRRKQAKKSHFWVRQIFQRCEEHGVFSNLVAELQLGDREDDRELSPQVLHFFAKTKLSSICLPFFFYLYTLFQNEFKETNFYLQCDFIIFLYNF